MEAWKDIKDYEGLYQISSLGRAKSLPTNNTYGKILKPGINSWGYRCISLYKNCQQKHAVVHRLVALHFIPNSDNKLEVNHKNGIKLDNRLKNLEWCTPSENMIHAVKNGFLKSQKGALNNNAKLNEVQVREIRSLYSTGNHKQKEIASKYNLSPQHINHIIHYKRWKNN